ncbi:hypothetical protein Ddye_001638 [Dipteronia dyeriana]|uniref:Uncharacterized protein n=1 Tax=Dipteronia dyeriana TaxID=168575 RepID=A0AAD9XP13_9ROSI|nr:hypothetical protein Ddye_001638 [Dipteronia dyeriana]
MIFLDKFTEERLRMRSVLFLRFEFCGLSFDGSLKLSMLAISWKIRGLGRVEKRRVVRNLVVNNKPTFLFIQESKLNYFDSRIIKSLGGSLLTKEVGVNVNG